MQIIAKGTFTPKDIRGALMLRNPMFQYFRYLLLFMVLVVVVNALLEFNSLGRMESVSPLRLGIALAVGVILYYLVFRYPIRQNLKSPGLQGVVEYHISEDGLSIRTTHSESNTAWSGFVRWKENSHLFSIQPSQYMVVMIPKRFFASPEDIQGAADIFRRHIPKR